jgi:nicotinate-nucleotide pyrophosphorylase (carboxylating)
MSRKLVPLHPLIYEDILRRALQEDLGRAGDLTTDAIVPLDLEASAGIVCRSPGCIAGIEVALSVFRLLDPSAQADICVPDGSRVQSGDILAVVRGLARGLLTAERTALNIVGRLSGIATATHNIVEKIGKSSTKVVCTRKTTPGLRSLEKYAVRAGGGFNHRFGLDDAVLIKDNHVAVAGGIRQAVARAREVIGHTVKIEVEVDTLEQLEETVELQVDAVLLDNMGLETVQQAVRIVDERLIIEVSGGITPESAVDLAATGVDLISLGWLTHSSPALDVSLDVS